MKNASVNPLSAEFLYELYAAALRYDTLCGVVAENMRKEFLPDRSFQKIQEVIANHYRTYKSPPTYATLSQTFQGDYDAIELLETFREYEEENTNTESLTDLLEGYIKGVRLQKVYTEVGKLYNQNRQDKAEALLAEYAGWLSSFTLRTTAFVDVAKTFRERFEHNRRREAESRENSLPQVCRFYIPYLDALNGGRDLRGQLTCFLASTGVGKSHLAKHIGIRADIDDGLHVLHYQLEGSEQEALDAYSGGMISRNAYYFEQGKISDREFKHFEELVMSYAGSITVRSFPRFAARISTMDIKNGIAEYRKINGYSPDVVIVDSMDLLTDATRRQWGAEHERSKRIAVANDLKDLAADENVWMVVTYQSTIEDRDWLNNERNALTEYNCSEAKGLARPCTHLISLNQSSAERKECLMRLHVAKSRFFRKGDTIKIATDYDNEVFYDPQRSMALQQMEET
ncbi:DnaB-like helicase C-terminal domain-containing protein [Butyricimonas sp.]|uniref:DnaB-like helicase C-terminal domain-containing protein n=1 Tax=Butyricimonas sp. TaxID=1969738 RepID=UPI0025BFB748|nr:DnaB-like helicase C-terminal domain-containing protein [Butyricimonas sp.]